MHQILLHISTACLFTGNISMLLESSHDWNEGSQFISKSVIVEVCKYKLFQVVACCVVQ